MFEARKIYVFGILSILSVFLLTACTTESPGGDDETSGDNGNVGNDSYSVGLSISTLNNPFFVTLRDGAEKVAEEHGIDLSVVDAQDDAATQANDIEDLIQQDIDLLLINPTDSDAVVSSIEIANNEGIPVVTIDRDADGGVVEAHIASDNVEGGEMAGEYLVELVGEDATVAVLEGIPGASATNERGEGFNNIAEDSLDIIASQTANFDRAEGLSVMENILQSNSDIEGIFAHNDEMALGALEALAGEGLEDDVVIIGFDATDDAVAAVEEGRMDATVAQLPEEIGSQAVQIALDILNGENVEDFIPVELELITE